MSLGHKSRLLVMQRNLRACRKNANHPSSSLWGEPKSNPVRFSGENCEDRVLDGPVSGEKGSQGRNKLDNWLSPCL